MQLKSIEQQAALLVHRVRQGFVKARTAQGNQIRSLLGEFGAARAGAARRCEQRVAAGLPAAIERLTEHLKDLDQQVRDLERQIIAWQRSSEASRELEKIPGIGPVGRHSAGGLDR